MQTSLSDRGRLLLLFKHCCVLTREDNVSISQFFSLGGK